MVGKGGADVVDDAMVEGEGEGGNAVEEPGELDDEKGEGGKGRTWREKGFAVVSGGERGRWRRSKRDVVEVVASMKKAYWGGRGLRGGGGVGARAEATDEGVARTRARERASLRRAEISYGAFYWADLAWAFNLHERTH
ncbi:hypothetical protein Syun_009961 [Stephania yunnanensis]|uniref:Uncharacterized protein n=1 Tax=Stephania yunnanensis TaxID=152371 RepID=A0AAP0KHZ2_9MAGN